MNTEQIGKALRRDKKLRAAWKKIIADAIRVSDIDVHSTYGYALVNTETAASNVLDALFGKEVKPDAKD